MYRSESLCSLWALVVLVILLGLPSPSAHSASHLIFKTPIIVPLRRKRMSHQTPKPLYVQVLLAIKFSDTIAQRNASRTPSQQITLDIISLSRACLSYSQLYRSCIVIARKGDPPLVIRALLPASRNSVHPRMLSNTKKRSIKFKAKSPAKVTPTQVLYSQLIVCFRHNAAVIPARAKQRLAIQPATAPASTSARSLSRPVEIRILVVKMSINDPA